MKKTDENLDCADALAEFSNLEPESADAFRKKRPGFVPDFWWKEAVTSLTGREAGKIWRACQANLRVAWKSEFPLTSCIKLINAGIRFDPPVEGVDYHAANAVAIPREQAAGYQVQINVESDLWLAGTRVWPYQQAVMYLSANPWRALFCSLCGNRFVADKPSRKFCSEDCTKKARKSSKLAWWNEHGQNWREGKAKKKPRKRKNP